jgi:hypothetical protein
MSHYIVRSPTWFPLIAAAASLGLALVAVGCTDESTHGACSWLFAPPSFVDAGQSGCIAEPAGQRCDASTGRCQGVCEEGEYLLTCQESEVSGFAIPEETLEDPVVSAGRGIKCSAVTGRTDGSRTATEYCCQCER